MDDRRQQTARWCNRDSGENVNEVRALLLQYRATHIKRGLHIFHTQPVQSVHSEFGLRENFSFSPNDMGLTVHELCQQAFVLYSFSP
jgi:hypothetical protein